MKKHWFGIILGLCWGLLLIFSSNAQADSSYEITAYQVQADIQSDGSAILTQRIHYDFDDAAHGVYYQQALGKQQQVKDISVAIEQNGKLSQVTPSTNGAQNTYQQTNTGQNVKLKVFHAVDNQAVTFIYRYRITNVITNWQDTAEMNWKIIGSGWDVPLNNIKITIQLPQYPVKQLQAWTHASTNGYTKVQRQRGRVIITAKSNPENSFIESRLLFPTNITPANLLIKSDNRKKTVQSQEAAWARKANQQREQRQLVQTIVFGILFCLGWITVLIVLWLMAKAKSHHQAWPRSTRQAVHSFEIPDFSAPVVQSLLSNRLPDSKALSAALVELAAQRKLAIEEQTEKIKFEQKPNYRITLLDSTLLKTANIWYQLFNTVGNGKSFTLQQLKQAGKSPMTSKRLQAAFKKWQKAQQKIAIEQNSVDQHIKHQNTWVTILTGAAIILLLGGSFGLNAKLLIGIAGSCSLLMIFLVIFFLKKHSPYTAEGVALVNQLRGFKKMLADIGRFNLKEVGELVLCEKIMPYAVAFGLAPKVAAALKANFDTEELESSFIIYYPFFINGKDFDFGEVFANSFSTSLASTSGSSGGFSGGNSGGFGGGSGGGAF